MDGNLSGVRCSKTPEDVIKEILKRVEKDSDGYAVGNIEPCYVRVDRRIYRNDVFISVKSNLLYRYRLMFVKCKKEGYPVTLLLPRGKKEDIQEIKTNYRSIGGSIDDLYIINSENMLRHFLNVILGSDFIQNLYKGIISEQKRRELLKHGIK